MKRLSAAILLAATIGALSLASAAMAFTKPFFTKKGTPFTSIVTSKVHMKNPAGQEVTCTGGSNEKGEIVAEGSKMAKKIVMKFTGCENEFKVKCASPGAAVGEIITKNLQGELGYIEPAVEGAKIVAFALSPEVPKVIVEYTCAKTSKIEGCFITKLSQAGVFTKTFTLVVEENAGETKPKSFEPEKGKKASCVLKSKVEAEPLLEEGWEFNDEIKITAPNEQKIQS